MLHRRPGAAILDVAPEFLEAEAAIRPREAIDATIMLVVLDTVEDEPGWVDAPRQNLLQNPRASSAFSASVM